ncbi:MAG: preprotein translocase subunit SecE [Clostridia bacterium]|nr:preprotein translocase subunit SecE [Clostridia bacterium]
MAELENKNVSAKAEKPQKAKKNADGKPGFFRRIANWFKGLKSEFKKITWASRKSTFKNFGIVLTIVVISAVVIGLVDIGLGAFFNFLLDVIDITPTV